MPSTSATQARSIARLIARRVKELRGAKGWNLDDLAAHADGKIARSTIGNVEAGARFLSLPALYALARAFGVSPAVLLLDPQRRPREEIAVAVLEANDATLARVASVLGVTVPKGRR